MSGKLWPDTDMEWQTTWAGLDEGKFKIKHKFLHSKPSVI